MKFHEFGQKKNPAVMLIHGGGNSWWNWLRQARVLDSVDQLLAYIETSCQGHLYALRGPFMPVFLIPSCNLLPHRPPISALFP